MSSWNSIRRTVSSWPAIAIMTEQRTELHLQKLKQLHQDIQGNVSFPLLPAVYLPILPSLIKQLFVAFDRP